MDNGDTLLCQSSTQGSVAQLSLGLMREPLVRKDLRELVAFTGFHIFGKVVQTCRRVICSQSAVIKTKVFHY